MGCKVCGEGPVGVGVVDGVADCRDSPVSRAGEPIGFFIAAFDVEEFEGTSSSRN